MESLKIRMTCKIVRDINTIMSKKLRTLNAIKMWRKKLKLWCIYPFN